MSPSSLLQPFHSSSLGISLAHSQPVRTRTAPESNLNPRPNLRFPTISLALLAIERASNIHHSRLKDPTRHFAGVGQRAAVGQAEQKGGVGVSAAEHKGTVLRGINDDAGEVKLKYHQTSESR